MDAMGAVVASGVGRRSRDVVGRWLLLLVALGGLFAMHGLSDHGVGAPAALASPAAHVESHMGVGHQLGADAASAESAHGAAVASMLPADLSTDSGNGHGDHHGGVLVGMCLAVLAAALLFGVVAWRARVLARLRHVLAEDPAAAAATAFWARARGPAPPDLTLLSILRC
jgi:hypothetical protein